MRHNDDGDEEGAVGGSPSVHALRRLCLMQEAGPLATYSTEFPGPKCKQAAVCVLLRASPRHNMAKSTTAPRTAGAVVQALREGGADMAAFLGNDGSGKEEGEEADVQVLFMKRQFSVRDKWSGDTCLPGGKREAGETLLQCAQREFMEETGVDLTTRDDVTCLGMLQPVTAKLSGGKTMYIAPAVFLFTGNAADMHFAPQDSEVACLWWVPLSRLLDVADAPFARMDTLRVPMSLYFPFIRKGIGSVLAGLFRLQHVLIAGIDLPLPEPEVVQRVREMRERVEKEAEASCSSASSSKRRRAFRKPEEMQWFLWGLSQQILSRLTSATGREPIYWDDRPMIWCEGKLNAVAFRTVHVLCHKFDWHWSRVVPWAVGLVVLLRLLLYAGVLWLAWRVVAPTLPL